MKFAGVIRVSWKAARSAGDLRFLRGLLVRVRGVMTGVPSGALGLAGTGGAGGGFPATTAASHSSIVGGAGFLMTGSAIALTLLLLRLRLLLSLPLHGANTKWPKQAPSPNCALEELFTEADPENRSPT
jgi:hypothetical protein